MFSMRPKYLDPILANSFTMDFIEITLTPRMPGLPIYKGSGSVSQDNKGNLHLKLYYPLSLDANFVRHYGENLSRVPGKLIRKERYFQFEAVDMSGDVWTSEILPLNNFSFLAAGTIITGNLRKIERSKERDKNPKRNFESALMVIPGKYHIPCNEIQNKPNGGWTRNICVMTVTGIKIRIQNEENHVILQASSDNRNFPEDFEWRLLEALSIFLGSLIFPMCHERRYMESEKTVIWGNMSDCNQQEVIPIKHPYDWEVDSLRNFIECYFRTFENLNQPFFTYWHRIHASWQSGYTENTALILCTSIEGIIKEYYRDTEYLDPKNILRQLSKRGWFEEKIVDEWGYMRNMSAHGERFFFEGTIKQKQKNFDKLHSCIHIFNVLLLRLIGFRGKYTNYSKDGWPLEDFPGENVSDSSETDGEN